MTIRLSLEVTPREPRGAEASIYVDSALLSCQGFPAFPIRTTARMCEIRGQERHPLGCQRVEERAANPISPMPMSSTFWGWTCGPTIARTSSGLGGGDVPLGVEVVGQRDTVVSMSVLDAAWSWDRASGHTQGACPAARIMTGNQGRDLIGRGGVSMGQRAESLADDFEQA